MNLSASKIFNESNHTKIAFDKKTALTLLLPAMFDWINEGMNDSNEV